MCVYICVCMCVYTYIYIYIYSYTYMARFGDSTTDAHLSIIPYHKSTILASDC